MEIEKMARLIIALAVLASLATASAASVVTCTCHTEYGQTTCTCY